jgi:hypothetical protein
MPMGSTEFLHLIAENDYAIVVDRAFAVGNLKRENISIKTRDGKNVSATTSQGHKVSPVELPHEILHELLRQSYVVEVKSEDVAERTIYELTEDGRKAGLALP